MNTQIEQIRGSESPSQAPPEIPARYVLYARKSSESDERQALSIDSQIKEMLQIADRERLEIVDVRRESHSAKDSSQRPVFNELLADIRSGRFNSILTWAPDRLSRNAGDLGSLVDLMDQQLLMEIRTYGQHFRNSPNEKFLLMILCSQAKLENDNKSVNVKRGLRMRCEMGLWPAPAPTGYLNEKRVDRKGYVLVDSERSHVVRQMFEKVANEQWSGRKIYHWLKFELNFRTAAGNKNLTLSNIYLILQNTFYYGSFEYPAKSGNWYTGKHQPLITRELFDKAREQLKRDDIKHGEPKEFAFTKMITCGHCTSSVCAQEKFKKLKNGDTKRYVYYGCSNSRDKTCRPGYIHEDELIGQMISIFEGLTVDQMPIKEKLKQEIERFSKFQRSFFGAEMDDRHAKIGLKDYARYLLSEGSIAEKRELLGCLQSKLILTEKVLSISK